jgi:hypothetical protein
VSISDAAEGLTFTHTAMVSLTLALPGFLLIPSSSTDHDITGLHLITFVSSNQAVL